MTLDDLDYRDLKLLRMVHRGRRDEHIAEAMGATVAAIEAELAALYQRMGVPGRVSAGMWYGDAVRAQKRECRGLPV